MQRAAVDKEIAVITRGHGKVVKNPGAARILTHLAKVDLQMAAAFERVKLLEKTPDSAPMKDDPVSKCRATAFAVRDAACASPTSSWAQSSNSTSLPSKSSTDKLGQLGYCLRHAGHKAAAKTGDEGLKNYWKFRVTQTAEIANECINKNWLPKKDELTATQKIAKSMREVEWPEGKQDRKFNAAALAWEAEHVVDEQCN